MSNKEKKIISFEEFEKNCNKSKFNLLTSSAVTLLSPFLYFFDTFDPTIILVLSMIKVGLDEIEFLKYFEANPYVRYKNILEYQEAYRSYYEVINNLSNMLEQLNWDNEAKIFAGYSYLLKNGYLSNNHEFCYSINSDSCFGHFLGSNVIDGFGDCKHINSFLTDLLNHNNYPAYNIGMNLTNSYIPLNSDGLNNNTEYDLVKEQEKEQKITQFREEYDKMYKFIEALVKLYIRRKKGPNHLVTLFSNDEYSYIMDAVNNAMFFVDDDKDVFCGDTYFSVSSLHYRNEKKINLSKLLKMSPREEMIGKLEDYFQIYAGCDECIDIFEKFYNDNKDLYREVSEKRKIFIRERKNYEKF